MQMLLVHPCVQGHDRHKIRQAEPGASYGGGMRQHAQLGSCLGLHCVCVKTSLLQSAHMGGCCSSHCIHSVFTGSQGTVDGFETESLQRSCSQAFE